MREGASQRARLRPQGPQMASVTEVVVPARGGAPAVPTRLYRPQPGPAPLVVFAHGGGWTIGGLDTHHRICRRLGHTSRAAGLSGGYPPAPQHPAPAARRGGGHGLGRGPPRAPPPPPPSNPGPPP